VCGHGKDSDPRHWRERAEEARTVADSLNDPQSKKAMLKIAKDYEELARRAERRAAGNQTQSKNLSKPPQLAASVKRNPGAAFLTFLSALLLFSTASAAQTTYWQAPFTGTGAPCVPRTDLGTLPSNNDDPVLVATRELINEGRPDNDQAYLDISNVMTQNYQCIPDSAHRAGRAEEPRCGSTQVSFTLPFRRKASANINLIFETTEMRFHGYANGAPLWIGTSDSGAAYAPYPVGYPNFCRAWNTNHLTRHNMSIVLMLPWPNILKPGTTMTMLIDNLYCPGGGCGRNRMWVIAE
jgi:hypothetical protein